MKRAIISTQKAAAVSLTEDQGLSHRTDQLLQNHAHKMHLIMSAGYIRDISVHSPQVPLFGIESEEVMGNDVRKNGLFPTGSSLWY